MNSRKFLMKIKKNIRSNNQATKILKIKQCVKNPRKTKQYNFKLVKASRQTCFYLPLCFSRVKILREINKYFFEKKKNIFVHLEKCI